MIQKLLFPFCVFLFASISYADWINLTGAENAPTIAEIYISDGHIQMNLEIYVDDTVHFTDLVSKNLNAFSKNVFQIRDNRGRALIPEVLLMEERTRIDRAGPYKYIKKSLPGMRVIPPPEDKRVLYVELKYPLVRKPKKLTLIPPLNENGRALITIGFIAYHNSVPIVDFRYLSQKERLILNWNDPWYTKFENKVLKRHHQSPLMSFLYIEPYEVRHEVLVRVRDLENWIDLGLKNSKLISPEEWEPLQQKISEFILTKNPVLIDGQKLTPILDKVDFVKVTLTGIQVLNEPQEIQPAAAIAGVVMAFITDGIPQKVSVDWQMFTPEIQKVPTNSIDPAGPFPSFITPDDPVHEWTNFLKKYKIPTIDTANTNQFSSGISFPWATTLCLAGLIPLALRIKKRGHPVKLSKNEWRSVAGLVLLGILLFPIFRISIPTPFSPGLGLSNEKGELLLSHLLKNVYRAFDFRREEDIYDKLAVSVKGDLLREIYLQNRKSFEIKRAGGATAKVKSVQIEEVDVKGLSATQKGVDIYSKWSALGTVGHWGHVHARQNIYEAVLTLEPEENSWKIAHIDLIEEKRVDPYAK